MDKTKPFIVITLVILATIKICASSIISVDIWWHMQLGRDLIHQLYVFWPDYYFSDVTMSYSDLRFTALGDMILYIVYFFGSEQGLIIFRILCVSMACFFVFLSSDKKITFFKIFILILMVVGCYQKMLIRNSLFALALFPFVLYLYDQKKYKSLVIVVSIWSLIHGSYLLGFGIIALMFLTAPTTNKKLLIPLLLLFFLISWGNPTTRQHYNLNRFKQIVTAKSLNQTIFKPGKLTSVDFKDPLEMINERVYIKTTILLAVLCMALVRPKWRYIVPFFAIAFIGLGYVRFVAYLSIISAYAIFKAEKEGNLREFDDKIFLVFLPFVIYFTIWHHDKIINNAATFNFDKSQIKFSDKCAKYAKIKYIDKETFTTMSNGGYVLFNHWNPEKKIYIDTFWQPHTSKVQKDYIKYILKPELIPYDSAIIGLTQPDLIYRFSNSKQWHIECVDQGAVLFTKQPLDHTTVFVTQEEINKMTQAHQDILLGTLRLCKKLAAP